MVRMIRLRRFVIDDEGDFEVSNDCVIVGWNRWSTLESFIK